MTGDLTTASLVAAIKALIDEGYIVYLWQDVTTDLAHVEALAKTFQMVDVASVSLKYDPSAQVFSVTR